MSSYLRLSAITLSLRLPLRIVQSFQEWFWSLHLFLEACFLCPLGLNLMLMLSLFESLDLPLIRTKDDSLNLGVILLLLQILIDSFDFLSQNLTFKGDLAIIRHLLLQCFLRCFSIIEALELSSVATMKQTCNTWLIRSSSSPRCSFLCKTIH